MKLKDATLSDIALELLRREQGEPVETPPRDRESIREARRQFTRDRVAERAARREGR